MKDNESYTATLEPLSMKTFGMQLNYLDSIFKHTSDLHYWLDKQSNFLMCNTSVAKLFGFQNPEQLIGQNFLTLSKNKGWSEQAIEVMDHNNLKVIETQEAQQFEEEIVFHSQAKKIFLSTKTPFINDKGEMIGLYISSIDITEKRLKEKEFARYFDYLLNNSQQNYYWLSLNGKILLCNKHQAKLFGYDKIEDVIGKTIYDFKEEFGWDDRIADSIRENDKKIISTMKSCVFEEKAVFDGQTHVFLSSKSPFFDENNNVLGIYGLTIDITEQKKRESQLKKSMRDAKAANKAKSHFLALINHELRIPLSAIIGMTKVFENEAEYLTPEQKKILADMKHASEHLLSLVNEVLDYSKLEAGKFKLNYDHFNLKSLISHIIQTFSYQAQLKKLELKCNYLSKIPEFIYSDENALKKILFNLINNALKFTESGYIELKLNCEFLSDKQCQIKFVVSDTGIGIPAEMQQQIFAKFEQIDSPIQKKYQGTGLGLSIVKELIHMLKGKISVESDFGKGAEFTIIIPFDFTQSTKSLTIQDSENVKNKLLGEKSKPLNILLVEDSKFLQLVHSRLIESMGHKVTLAEQGAEVLGMDLNKFDLILLDLGLPDIDGFEICNTIRRRKNKNDKAIPIIALTGYDDIDSQEKAKKVGIDFLISKPPEPKKLSELFNKIRDC